MMLWLVTIQCFWPGCWAVRSESWKPLVFHWWGRPVCLHRSESDPALWSGYGCPPGGGARSPKTGGESRKRWRKEVNFVVENFKIANVKWEERLPTTTALHKTTTNIREQNCFTFPQNSARETQRDMEGTSTSQTVESSDLVTQKKISFGCSAWKATVESADGCARWRPAPKRRSWTKNKEETLDWHLLAFSSQSGWGGHEMCFSVLRDDGQRDRMTGLFQSLIRKKGNYGERGLMCVYVFFFIVYCVYLFIWLNETSTNTSTTCFVFFQMFNSSFCPYRDTFSTVFLDSS